MAATNHHIAREPRRAARQHGGEASNANRVACWLSNVLGRRRRRRKDGRGSLGEAAGVDRSRENLEVRNGAPQPRGAGEGQSR